MEENQEKRSIISYLLARLPWSSNGAEVSALSNTLQLYIYTPVVYSENVQTTSAIDCHHNVTRPVTYQQLCAMSSATVMTYDKETEITDHKSFNRISSLQQC